MQIQYSTAIEICRYSTLQPSKYADIVLYSHRNMQILYSHRNMQIQYSTAIEICKAKLIFANSQPNLQTAMTKITGSLTDYGKTPKY
jgi:hypothetical protein